MIKRDKMKEIPIKEGDLVNISEKKGRVFKVKFTDSNTHIKSERCFLTKDNLNKFLNNPNLTKIRLYMGDVVYE